MATFWKTRTGEAVVAVITAQNEYASSITVQQGHRVNFDIIVGSIVSDMMSSVSPTSAISGVLSTMSASIVLQRQVNEWIGTTFWHDVEEWAVLKADGEAASSQNISVTPEPEQCRYRAGVKTGSFDSGACILRVGSDQ